MAKDNKFSGQLSALSSKLKAEPAQVPIQEVKPVAQAKPVRSPSKKATEKGDAHLNCWIPAALMKKLKLYALETDQSITSATIEALEGLLKGK